LRSRKKNLSGMRAAQLLKCVFGLVFGNEAKNGQPEKEREAKADSLGKLF